MILHLNTRNCPSNLTVVHLQKLFIEMNKRIPKASSLNIIQSFEWSQEEKNSQHDIHEFSRFFLELLQTQITNQGLPANFFENFMVLFFLQLYLHTFQLIVILFLLIFHFQSKIHQILKVI
jgi:hypothetical protein